MIPPNAPFSDPEAVARYTEMPPRFVPGLDALHRMATLLLAERCAADARILVLGAGGGLELKVFATAQPGWRFAGVDPSTEMLALAGRTLGPLAARVDLHAGYIDTAPPGPFDAATCLLTLHFLPPAARVQTLAALFARLKPGAPLVVAHHSFPQAPEEKPVWLSRFAAFATASGVAAETAQGAAEGIGRQLPALSPEQDAALLADAGFVDVSLFYAALTFRGWVAYRP
ncbi:class I SAM-dependent methyltransferase [Roseomonas sp. CECT 9278]|uniref:class I SAM-dependent methyltransferase n=1 Tax=Roseomonas sp. CECT 9278 TaxID=2845823 RepID=UPI001E48C585|nr:class I SAM-dependent methyltransferase [Roseomonas sp. CECT 9278]CAH0279008.1 Carboxy-S-adenosyl-L-methionine synthase [Roseomonas sp. CECT 9278]